MTKHDPLCWRSKTPVSDLGGPCVCDVIRQARADEKAKADLATSMWEQEVARLRAELDEALGLSLAWRKRYEAEVAYLEQRADQIQSDYLSRLIDEGWMSGEDVSRLVSEKNAYGGVHRQGAGCAGEVEGEAER